jgi:hypothetical protein
MPRVRFTRALPVATFSLFELVNVRGHRGWNSWPSFEEDERVVLFLGAGGFAAETRTLGGAGSECARSL